MAAVVQPVIQPVVQPEIIPYDGVPPNVCDFCLQTFTSPVGVKKHKTKVRCTKNVPCTQIFIEKYNLGELDLTKSAEQYREHLAKKHAKDNGDLLPKNDLIQKVEVLVDNVKQKVEDKEDPVPIAQQVVYDNSGRKETIEEQLAYANAVIAAKEKKLTLLKLHLEELNTRFERHVSYTQSQQEWFEHEIQTIKEISNWKDAKLVFR